MEEVLENYELVFKVKVKMHKLLAHAFIFFSIDRQTKTSLFDYVLCSLKPQTFDDISINFKWEILKEKIFDISVNKSIHLNQSITEDIKTSLKYHLDKEEFRENIFEYAEKNMYNELKSELIKIFCELSDRIDIQCETEKYVLMKSAAYETDDKSEDSYEQTDSDGSEDSDSRKFIQMDVIEDKLLGKPIGKLLPNDKVVVKVLDEKFNRKYVGQSIASSEYVSNFIEYYSDQGINYAVFRIIPGFFGKTAAYNPKKMIKTVINSKNYEPDISFISDNTFVFYLIVILTAIILIILTWIYYEWVF